MELVMMIVVYKCVVFLSFIKGFGKQGELLPSSQENLLLSVMVHLGILNSDFTEGLPCNTLNRTSSFMNIQASFALVLLLFKTYFLWK